MQSKLNSRSQPKLKSNIKRGALTVPNTPKNEVIMNKYPPKGDIGDENQTFVDVDTILDDVK